MANEPLIFTQNYIDSLSPISTLKDIGAGPVATSYTTTGRLYDRDARAQFMTWGENDDDTKTIIDIEFPNIITVDRMILLATNVKAFSATYTPYGGSGGNAIITTPTVFPYPSGLVSFSSLNIVGFQLQINSTSTADREKWISEMILCKLILDVGSDISQYDVSYRQSIYSTPLADGSVHSTKVLFSPTRSTKYEAKVRFDFLTLTQLESLRLIKDSGQAFTWMPESISNPLDTFYVNWVGNFSYKFMSTCKGAGYSLTMDLKEV